MNEIVQHAEAQAPALSHPLPVAGAGNLLTVIGRAASDPSIDVSKMQQMMEMQERLEARQAEREFNDAFMRLSARLPRVKKNGLITYEGTGRNRAPLKYAKYEDLDRAIRSELREEGFALSFSTSTRAGGGVAIVGKLRHISGHAEEATVELPADASGGKNSIQAIGSAISYAQRYAVKLLLNIVFEGEDTDAQGGSAFIGPEQVKEIEDRLAKLGAASGQERENFLDYMEVGSLEGITTKTFPKALNALTAREKRAGGARP